MLRQSGPKPKERPCRTGVYFIRWGAFVKVGYAYDVEVRRRNFYSWIPEGEIEAVAWIPCRNNYVWMERNVLDALRPYRARREWFRDCQEVRWFIERHAMRWPVGVSR